MKGFVVAGALFAAVAVAAGAFGAHALADRLSAARLATWETAARYHLIHSLALVMLGALGQANRNRILVLAGWLFVGGIPLFSGSLYALALGGPSRLGVVTPFGGASFVAAWLLIAYGFEDVKRM